MSHEKVARTIAGNDSNAPMHKKANPSAVETDTRTGYDHLSEHCVTEEWANRCERARK